MQAICWYYCISRDIRAELRHFKKFCSFLLNAQYLSFLVLNSLSTCILDNIKLKIFLFLHSFSILDIKKLKKLFLHSFSILDIKKLKCLHMMIAPQTAYPESNAT